LLQELNAAVLEVKFKHRGHKGFTEATEKTPAKTRRSKGKTKLYVEI
jgi:hypothetical protein